MASSVPPGFLLSLTSCCWTSFFILRNSADRPPQSYLWKWKVKVLVTQSCLTLWDSMACSPPGSSVRGNFWARILEWVAIPYSRGSSQPRNRACISCIACRFFTVWATREVLYLPICQSFTPQVWLRHSAISSSTVSPSNPLICHLKCSVLLTWSISCPPVAWKIRKDKARVSLVCQKRQSSGQPCLWLNFQNLV